MAQEGPNGSVLREVHLKRNNHRHGYGSGLPRIQMTVTIVVPSFITSTSDPVAQAFFRDGSTCC
ncbi:hypothetical protein BD311DRAFT_752781, partial [Dichomitus squalens]